MLFQSYLNWFSSQIVNHCTLQKKSNELNSADNKYFLHSTSTDIKQIETSRLGGLFSPYFPSASGPHGFQSAHASSKSQKQQDYWVSSFPTPCSTGLELHMLEKREEAATVFVVVVKTTIWLSILSDKHFPSKLLLLIKAGFTIERQANSFSPVQWHGLSPVTAANHSSKGYDSCLCGCLFLAAIIKGQQRNKDRAHTRPS